MNGNKGEFKILFLGVKMHVEILEITTRIEGSRLIMIKLMC